ncbi:MAG: hypothetical protein GXP31_19500 [Kiritimatiellaeota bacterium]|nr:hypothetical protein [Kiritimatiellota bacterium]
MNSRFVRSLVGLGILMLAVGFGPGGRTNAAPAVSIRSRAARPQLTSSTRERICINGLWRFRPETVVRGPRRVFFEGFEDPALPGWERGKPARGSWTPVSDTQVVHGGKRALRIAFHLPAGTNFYHFHRRVDLEPDTPYRLTAYVRAHLDSGQLRIEIQDARGYKFFTTATNNLGRTLQWRRVRLDFRTPKDTHAVNVYVRYYGHPPALEGTVWLDDLTIDEVREPDLAKFAPPENAPWGRLKVPGNWAGPYFRAEPPPDEPAGGDYRGLQYAWYERELAIPAAWKGRRVLLRLDKVATDAVVWCNGRRAGRLGYMGGTVDLTRFVTPGMTARVDIFLAARDPANVLAGLGGKRILGWRPWQRGLKSRGIVGDAWLESEPVAPPRLGPFLIITSVQKREIAVRAEIDAPDGAPSGCELRIRVLDGDRVVKRFSGTMPAGARRARAAASWPDAVLWDVGTPKLYHLVAGLYRNGRPLDESLPERFGFREFEIRGKYFYLNGTRINLRPASYTATILAWASRDCMERWLDKTVAEGHNFVYTATVDFPGRVGWVRHFLDVCDEKGVLTAITPAEIKLCWDMLDRPEVRRPWEEAVRARITRDWNHPSLVLWRMNMNLCGYNQDQHPLLLDSSMRLPADSDKAKKAAAALASNAFVETLDPTRKTYNHAGGDTGNIYTLNNYLCWPQPQDLREWLRTWAERGKKPLMMVEFDLPYPGSFSMNDPTHWWSNEPLMAEYGAILLGPRAYRLIEPDYLDFIDDYAWDREGKTWRSAYGYYCFAFPRIIDECSSEFYRIVAPAWRTWGIPGGLNSWENTGRRLRKIESTPGRWKMRAYAPDLPLSADERSARQPGFHPDVFHYARGGGGEIRCNFDLGRPEEKEYFEPTLRGRVMHEVCQPVIAWIAGPARDWTSVDHAFYAGERVQKDLIIINDSRRTARFSVRWQARGESGLVAEGRSETTVPPGANARIPMAFTAPSVADREEVVFSAVVRSADGEIPVRPFAVQVFAKSAPVRAEFRGWTLYDPAGRTRAALERIGVRIPPLEAGTSLPPDLRVLVIGCLALDQGPRPAWFKELSGRIADGLRVLVFEQSAAVLEADFGLRAVTRGTSRMWLCDAASPLVRGLRSEDFRNWRGSSTLAPPDGKPESPLDSQRWNHVWRCTQRNVVASTVVEKPHCGAFHPIVHGEFDLRYMALWEAFEGRGRLIFCQLDVTDRLGRDPAADRVVRNLLTALNEPSKPHRPLEVFLAGDAELIARNIAPLRLARAKSAPAVLPGVNPDAALLVLVRGCGPWVRRNAAGIRAFLASGGRAVAVGLAPGDAGELANAAQTFRVRTIRRLTFLDAAAPKGRGPASTFGGVGPAELCWREPRAAVMPAPRDAAGGKEYPLYIVDQAPVGKGWIAWVPVLPSDFDPERRPDLIFTKVNAQRLLALVLTNLGVRSTIMWSGGFLKPPPDSADRPLPAHALAPTRFYLDGRRPRDDPYAYMRW